MSRGNESRPNWAYVVLLGTRLFRTESSECASHEQKNDNNKHKLTDWSEFWFTFFGLSGSKCWNSEEKCQPKSLKWMCLHFTCVISWAPMIEATLLKFYIVNYLYVCWDFAIVNRRKYFSINFLDTPYIIHKFSTAVIAQFVECENVCSSRGAPENREKSKKKNEEKKTNCATKNQKQNRQQNVTVSWHW